MAQKERKETKKAKLAATAGLPLKGKFISSDAVPKLLEAILHPGDRVCLEGNNQKQAAFLIKSLNKVDPERVKGLKLALSAIILPECLDLFERGICESVDFAYAGPQGQRLARMFTDGSIKINNIHTYIEIYARYFSDLTLDVCLITAEAADQQGNLYTGPNTEDSPAIIEAAAFYSGIVVVQVNEILDRLPRVDIPGDWVDFIVKTPEKYEIKPLFTRDPAKMDELKILMGMLVLKGIYAKYLPKTLNHGIGFPTACIELLLPTYGEQLGLKGKACTHWILNPHPTLIPAIESGFVERVITVGAEVGMNGYVSAKPDIFPIGADGSMRSNRAFGQLSGHYADMFIGSTLQIDVQGNSSTVTEERLVGFGGAPNFGCQPGARRHNSNSWLAAGAEALGGSRAPLRGRKLVVQIVETFQSNMIPTFVEELDAVKIKEKAGMPVVPIMIYGEEVSHIVTEEGIANLLMCRNLEEREQAVRGVAGFTPVGLGRDKKAVEELRARGVIQRAEDLGISKRDATRDMLAAKDVRDLVRWSKGLYQPPEAFHNW